MTSDVRVLRCPRCGSMDVGVATTELAEQSDLHCRSCGFFRTCDEHRLRGDWNEIADAEECRGEVLLPRPRFASMWRALGAKGDGDAVLRSLRAAYRAPERAYHTGRHLGACLAVLDELSSAMDPAARPAPATAAEIEAALWFHDAVYDPRASDNEERSARMAEDALRHAGVASDVGERVAAHVRATRDHAAATPEAALVVDVDLSILGAPWPVFVRFEDEIRREYAWVGAADFVTGRAAVLRRFLSQPRVYATDIAAARFEARARVNLRAALAVRFRDALDHTLALARAWCDRPAAAEAWERGEGRWLDDEARRRAGAHDETRARTSAAFERSRVLLARAFPDEWHAWLRRMASERGRAPNRDATTAASFAALEAECGDRPKDAWTLATALHVAATVAPPTRVHKLRPLPIVAD